MSISYRIKIDEKVILDAIDTQLNEIADQIFSKSQENIVTKGIIDEGTLLKVGNVNRQYLDKEIIYPTPYAESIEYGREPGTFPPITALQGWVKRKLGIKGDKESKQIAFLIARDIKRNGSVPRPFLTPAIEAIKQKYGR